MTGARVPCEKNRMRTWEMDEEASREREQDRVYVERDFSPIEFICRPVEASAV